LSYVFRYLTKILKLKYTQLIIVVFTSTYNLQFFYSQKKIFNKIPKVGICGGTESIENPIVKNWSHQSFKKVVTNSHKHIEQKMG
jgi:hypothetical protein